MLEVRRQHKGGLTNPVTDPSGQASLKVSMYEQGASSIVIGKDFRTRHHGLSVVTYCTRARRITPILTSIAKFVGQNDGFRTELLSEYLL
jgi:hypothetical protein